MYASVVIRGLDAALTLHTGTYVRDCTARHVVPGHLIKTIKTENITHKCNMT